MYIVPETNYYVVNIFLCMMAIGIGGFFYCRSNKIENMLSLSFGISALILGFFSTVYYYPFNASILPQIIWKLLILFVCYSFSFYYGIRMLYHITNRRFINGNQQYVASYRRNVMILGIMWLPNLLTQYPAAFCPDAVGQLAQYLSTSYSSHHPVVHSYLIGLFVNLGKVVFGSYNIGIFIFILFQYLFMLLTFAYTIFYLECIGINRKYRNVLWLIYGICPLIIGYIGVVLKDVLYSTCVVWFIVFCVKFFNKDLYNLQRSTMVGLILSSVGVILTRNNGKFIVYPTCLIIVLITLFKTKVSTHIMRSILVLGLPIIISTVILISFNSYYNVIPGSDREIFSLCFQQTARVVKEHSDEISLEEREIIDRVLAYDQLAEFYDPYLSDPVKATFKDGVSDEYFLEYLKLWFRQFFEYPITYCEATLQQNYPLFSLPFRNQIFYFDSSVEIGDEEVISDVPFIETINSYMIKFYAAIDNIPIVNLFSSMSFYCIMLLILSLYCFGRKCWKLFIPLLPLWVSFLICVAAPGIFNHPRYAYPIVYAMPFLFGIYLAETSQDKLNDQVIYG